MYLTGVPCLRSEKTTLEAEIDREILALVQGGAEDPTLLMPQVLAALSADHRSTLHAEDHAPPPSAGPEHELSSIGQKLAAAVGQDFVDDLMQQ